jgi:hypothetical protein
VIALPKFTRRTFTNARRRTNAACRGREDSCVKAGKHIYMEKPAGLDLAGCKRVMRIADEADRKQNITFGFQQRYGAFTSRRNKCWIPEASEEFVKCTESS